MNTFHAVTFRIRYCVDDEVGQGVQCEHRKSGPITGVIRSNHWSCNPLFAFVIFSCKLCFFAVLLSSGMCFTFPSSIHPSNHFGIHIYALLFKGCGNTRLSGSCNTLSAEQVRSSSAESGDFAARWQHLSISISIVCSYISDYCGITVSPKQTNHQDHHQNSNSLARALRSCYHPNALITSF
jgi:hypothetical protein